MHRDSLGFGQSIDAGEVNWMTAGRGITHSERFEQLRAHGGKLDGIQAWVALPVEREEKDPGFWHYPRQALPRFSEGGATGCLIAGQLAGVQSPVAVDSPQFYVHWQLGSGARVSLPAEYSERAVYVASGSVEIDGVEVAAGNMAVLRAGAAVTLAASTDAVVMALGGRARWVPLHRLEFRVVIEGTDRAGAGRLDSGSDEAA